MPRTRPTDLITSVLTHQPAPWPVNQSDKDINLFIELAQHHGVLALLSAHQGELEEQNWPTQIIQSIAIGSKTAQHIEAQRRQTIINVFKALSKKNIPALLFKGAANACLLYLGPHLRTHADVDILIQESQFTEVKNTLCGMGFVFDPIEPTKYGPSQTTAIMKNSGHSNHVFDIHWKINNRLVLANTLEFDELRGRAIAIDQYGDYARGFSYADAILAACIHEAGSLDTEKGKLISLYDVYLLLKKLDTHELKALSQRVSEKKISTLYALYLNQCINTFCRNTPEDNELAINVLTALKDTDINPNELSVKLVTGKKTWASNQWLDFCSVNGMINKFDFIITKFMRKR